MSRDKNLKMTAFLFPIRRLQIVLLILSCIFISLFSCSGDSRISGPLHVSAGQSLRIAFVHYHDETREYSWILHPEKPIDWTEWEESILPGLGKPFHKGNLDYGDGYYYSRYELPAEIARSYAPVDGFEHVKIYNSENKCLGEAQFVRYEFVYFSNGPQIVATFRLDSETDKGIYAVAGLDKALPAIAPINSGMITNNSIGQDLLDSYSKDSMRYMRYEHYGLDSTIYTFIQVNNWEDLLGITNILETRNGETKRLMELKDWFLLEQTQVIPLLYNKKPVFIVVGGIKGVGDEDKVYSILLRYENGKYGFNVPYDVLKGK